MSRWLGTNPYVSRLSNEKIKCKQGCRSAPILPQSHPKNSQEERNVHSLTNRYVSGGTAESAQGLSEGRLVHAGLQCRDGVGGSRRLAPSRGRAGTACAGLRDGCQSCGGDAGPGRGGAHGTEAPTDLDVERILAGVGREPGRVCSGRGCLVESTTRDRKTGCASGIQARR